MRKWRFGPYALAYSILSIIFRVRAHRTVFLSDSRATYSGNIRFLRDEITRQDPHAEIFGIFKRGLTRRRSLRDIIRLPYLTATAQTIVLDDYYPLIYPFRIRHGSRLVQVWHAAGAFKRVGYSREGLPGGPLPGSIIHRNYTDVPVSAEDVRPNFAEAFGLDISRVKALGMARTDVFFDQAHIATATHAVRQRYGIGDGVKIALYAPTFRGNGQVTARFDYDSVDWDSLAASLGPGWAVLVKMHPFVTPLTVARPDVRHVIDVTTDREITELLMAADVLITDYSSTIFEYALLRRPIVFFCPDLEQYTADRSFYHPFEDYVTGPMVRDSADLPGAIRGAAVSPALDAFLERFMGACDGHSTERIVRELILTPPTDGNLQTTAPGGSTPAPTTANGKMGLRLLVAYTARIGVNLIYQPLQLLLPRRRKVVMISREHSTVPADFADIAVALRRTDPSVRIVTLVRMVPAGYVAKAGYALHMLRQLYHVATARVLVVDTYAMVASLPYHGRGLTVIQIWHALGAFKKFGLSILGHEEGRDARLAKAMRMHRGYDLVLASSEAARVPFADALGVGVSQTAVAPLPRVDRLVDPARRARTRERILTAHPELRGQRIALFAPTFRLDGTVTVDVPALTRALAAIGVHVVASLHPLMPHAFGDDVDTGEGFSTQELLDVADLFITDYSSTLFEAALLGLPSYFLAPDLDDYLASRDFYLDYRTELPGPISTDVAGLVQAVAAGAADTEASRRFAARWVEVPEGSTSADRIATLVTAAMPGASGRNAVGRA